MGNGHTSFIEIFTVDSLRHLPSSTPSCTNSITIVNYAYAMEQ